MKNSIIKTCILSLAIIIAPMPLQADMVDTSTLVQQETRLAQLDIVQNFMAREEIQQQLQSMGVHPILASERIASLTDSELQQLSVNIENAPAGSGALGIVAGVLIILLLLEILGITDMSSKV